MASSRNETPGPRGREQHVRDEPRRQDGGSGAPRLRVELEISMGFTASPPDLPNPTFAQNWSAPPTVVFDRKVLDLPDLASTRVPAPFDPRFDLDRPFLDGSSQNLAIDFKARNLSTILPLYVLDAVDAVGDTVGHLYANDPNATIGTGDDRGLVMFLHGWQAGGAAPSIGGTPPVLGGTYAVTLHRAAVGQTAILLTGLSDQRWLGFALPIDLTLFGAPGCRWYVSGELSFQDRVSSSGTAKQGIPIPQDPRLAGRPLFSQWAVLDLPANPAGVVWSDAARAVMGY